MNPIVARIQNRWPGAASLVHTLLTLQHAAVIDDEATFDLILTVLTGMGATGDEASEAVEWIHDEELVELCECGSHFRVAIGALEAS